MRSPIPSYLDDVLASVASDKTGNSQTIFLSWRE